MQKKAKKGKIFVTILILAACILLVMIYSFRQSAKKYGGHGFEYMHGYSSTDFKDYMVYSENSKLVSLEKEASLRIEKEEDMPVLDGAEACYPLYAAFAKAVYKDIDSIEKQWLKEADDQRFNGKIVTFSNSISGFTRLVRGGSDPVKYGDGVDMFFGARPSEMQDFLAEEDGVEIEITPIGREAFIFFVEADNPIDNLTTEQFKAIYHGDITNWSEVGGNDQKIKAFQRPKNSGSQTMMEYFMGDVSLKEPETYEVINPMDGIVKRVAQYADDKGALGYSFRYFVEELNQEKNVKILSIDEVYPSLESIEDGSYPLVTDVCVMTRKGDANPYIAKMIDFILSEEGQTIVWKTGYAGVEKQAEEVITSEEDNVDVATLINEIKGGAKKELCKKLYEMQTTVDTVPDIIKKWNRTGVHGSHAAELDIMAADEAGFDFQIFASYYYHSGVATGRAYYISEDCAVYRLEEMDLFPLPEEEYEYIVFILEKECIQVYASASSAELGLGMNVYMDGTYIDGEPVYTNAGILEKTYTEEQLKFAKENLPDDYYERLIFATEFGGVGSYAEDGIISVEAFVPTAGQYNYNLKMNENMILSIVFGDGTEFAFDRTPNQENQNGEKQEMCEGVPLAPEGFTKP